jgi:hypothetical protein
MIKGGVVDVSPPVIKTCAAKVGEPVHVIADDVGSLATFNVPDEIFDALVVSVVADGANPIISEGVNVTTPVLPATEITPADPENNAAAFNMSYIPFPGVI